jgi:nucleotide-binding universal stress UspA family protein
MGFKDLLLQVDDSRGRESRLNLAVDIARRQGAQLTGLFALEPLDLSGLVAPSGADIATVQALDEIRERYRAQRRAAGDRLRAGFDDATRRAGIASEWRALEGDPAELAIHEARYADLFILGQSDPDEPLSRADIPGAVLLGAGRPVLVIPFIGSESVGRNVLVAWRTTREAARAVNDALPFLTTAERVTVLTINPERDGDGEPDRSTAEIARHLARHGIKAEASHIDAADIEVGEALLSRAADLDNDLIVMGGYGHSRLREFALGGTTRALLQHMTVPVLLSH